MRGDPQTVSLVAQALREAGYVPLPRFWVKPEDMEIIRRMAFRHAGVVNEIRGRINREAEENHQPHLNRDQAWEAFERSRFGNQKR